MVGPNMSREELTHWLDWADIIHYHNRNKRLEIFKRVPYRKKPGVIQIHSPRLSEDFSPEVKSGLPIAVIAQYHPRQWEKELTYMIPNVLDIYDHIHGYNPRKHRANSPIVGYSPSNWNAKGWDDKGYGLVGPFLKKMCMFKRTIDYQLIVRKPFLEAMHMKQQCHIGIDEVITGSYHLSSLEFLSMGCATFAYLDDLTQGYLKEVVGAYELPWVNVDKDHFQGRFLDMVRNKDWDEYGINSRKWMEKYFDPHKLCSIYRTMYNDILEKQA